MEALRDPFNDIVEDLKEFGLDVSSLHAETDNSKSSDMSEMSDISESSDIVERSNAAGSSHAVESAVQAAQDAVEGQEAVLIALIWATRDKSTEWKRPSEMPGFVLRRDMDLLKQSSRADQLRFYVQKPPETRQDSDDDVARKRLQPSPKRRRTGEGSSKDQHLS